jgi:hypothetical protein
MKKDFKLLKNLKDSTKPSDAQKVDSLKKTIYAAVEKYNDLVKISWEIDHQIADLEAKLPSSSDGKPSKPHNALENKKETEVIRQNLKKLKEQKKTITDSIKKNNSEAILSTKLKELEVQAKKINSKIDINSPSFVVRKI